MTQFASLPDGRRLAFDDVGRSDGFPVVYLHGFPDSRFARHPDDSLAATVGVRLLAVDRPGYGASDLDPQATRVSTAQDVIAMLDQLEISSAAILGWSAGGQYALACGAVAPGRVSAIVVASGTAPSEMPADNAVIDEVTSLVLPADMTYELAREYVTENKPEAYLRDLASIDGLHEQLAHALLGATPGGVRRDVRNVFTPWEFDLSSVTPPVTLWYGDADHVNALTVGVQLADALPNAQLRVIEGATHLLLVTHWTQILESLRRELTCR